MMRIEYQRGGVWLPEVGLWLDPHEARGGAERVFVSHAHSDHMARHREVIWSPGTAKLGRSRMPGERVEHVLEFGETRMFAGPVGPYAVTLTPAGHILGSAMAFVQFKGESLLYTGDFKLRAGISAERCNPCAADVLVMETTFGRPHYRFPSTEEILKGVIRFCREALDNEEIPVLLGYSLGKSQEILSGLAEAGVPVALHSSVAKLTGVYEELGRTFPPYVLFDPANAAGKVVICPPGTVGLAQLRKAGKTRTAMLTGWAMDSGCRYRYGCDAAFPLSDHADYPELVELVRQVRPRRVYTLHGFAAEFARDLRELGFDAQALSETEQLSLDLGAVSAATKETVKKAECPAEVATEKGGEGNSFRRFAEVCAGIGGTAGKSDKVRLLADYIRTLPEGELGRVVGWLSGKLFAAAEQKALQVGGSPIRDALCKVTSKTVEQFQAVYLKHNDLGEAASELMGQHAVEGPPLTLGAVGQFFEELAAARGARGKVPILVRELCRCGAAEVRYLVKIATGDLRIGLKEELVEEAIGVAFGQPVEAVRRANRLLGDIGHTAVLARRGTLGEADITMFRPVGFMVAAAVESAREAHELMMAREKERAGRGMGSVARGEELEVWIEERYDGMRCQLHKEGTRVALYSQDLKEVTRSFPEVEHALRDWPVDLIADGAIVAMRGDRALPFSELQKRLGRREDDFFIGEEIPIRVVLFDLLRIGDVSCLDQPLTQRRRTLERLPGLPGCLRVVPITRARSGEEIEAALGLARERGNGIMIKDPASAYVPSQRGMGWVEL